MLVDLAFEGVAGQVDLLRRGEISARELVENALVRIERLDRELNAFGGFTPSAAWSRPTGPMRAGHAALVY